MQNRNNDKREERRSGSDRRMYAIDLGFPFIDSHGHLVTQERRQCNRRKSIELANATTKLAQQKNYA